MPLVNIKMSKEEQKNQFGGIDEEDARYPYGTRLDLEGPTVAKLGIEKLSAGDEVEVTAMAVVKSVDISDVEKQGVTTRIGLQITDMRVATLTDSEEVAVKMFPTHAKRGKTNA